MNNDNLILQSFWHGSKLSTMELLCIKSFLHHGHVFHLYSYDEINYLPEGCILYNANSVVQQENIFFDSRGGISGFANYFRIHLLYKKGGWWVDLDMICLKPFDFKEEFCFCSEYKLDNSIGYTNCCIKSPQKSEFLQDYIQTFDKMLNTYEIIPWGSTGPVLISNLLTLYDSTAFIQAPTTFCPINWFDVKKIVVEGGEIPSNSYAIHLYNEMWRLNKMDKNKKYPQNSIYELLKMKYSQPALHPNK